VLAQIEIMAALMEKLGGKDPAAESTASALRRLRQIIIGEPQAASANGGSTPAGASSGETAKPATRRRQNSNTAPVKESKPMKPKAARKPRKRRQSDS
jgi:hypothetical protein